MGADHAIHLSDPVFDTLDNLSVAGAPARAIETLSFDLILCGRQAVDDDMAQVGPALAVFLKLPFVSVITGLTFSEDFSGANITRQIEGGSESFDVSVPFLVTCQKGLNVPRLPSLKGIIAAKKKQIETRSAKDIGFDASSIGPSRVRQVDLALPPERKKGQILAGSLGESLPELVRLLREEEKVV